MSSALRSFEKVLRFGEGQRMKRLPSRPRTSTRSSPTSRSSPTTSYAARRPSSAQRLENGEDARGPPLRGVRRGPRGAQARVRPAHLRRPADGRHRAPRGRHRRDEDRRGQDVRREPRALPERARRQGRPPRHGQRLPRPARRRVEPAGLRGARHDRRAHREHDAVRRAQGRLRRGHHLRHELRVRLRLPARQHGRLARRDRAARPPVRDRGRGRLDPHRRGAHAADHLRRARGRRADLLRLRARREGR